MAHPGHRRLAPEPAHAGRPRQRRAILGAVLAASLVVAAAVVFVSLSGWDRQTGRALAATSIDPIDGPNDHQVPAGDAYLQGSPQSSMVDAITADLTRFWSQTLPPITGQPFSELRGGLTAVDSNAESGSAPCVATPNDIMGNAYYCPSSDGIVYDASTLVPVVLHRYGVGGLITTFAHEFGHAVEARIASAATDGARTNGSATKTPPPLVTEARADCDAGAFLAWVAQGHAHHLHVDPAAMLTVIGPLVDFSDPATVQPDDPTAHGLAVDRLTWFLTGYRSGADPCADLGEPLTTALGTIPATDDPHADAQPRYGSAAALIAAAQHSVQAFSGKSATRKPIPALWHSAAVHGDFAQATAVALANAGNDPVAGACFAGSWVRSVFGHAGPGTLGSHPGDADEGLAAVLLAPGASFESAAGYIDGFQRGESAC